MKILWDVINKMKLNSYKKNKLYLFIRILINSVFGGIVWFLLGRLFLTKIEWLFCFIGFPGLFIGFFGGILYLYNHEFS